MRGISPCWLLLLRLLFVARVATANDGKFLASKVSVANPSIRRLTARLVASGWVYQGYIDALSYAARLVVRPESATVQLESRVSFFCRADGNPLPSISWRRNGHVISEAR
uniref:Ig-like domain-containing protein n=1 Tax=Plectus sambesii TaxID=2011161 RepID=A0A914WDW5_9BILA